MQAFRAGEQQAFGHVYGLLYERVFWYAKKFVDTDADAEDLTADSFIQLWKNRAALTNFEGISAFLHVTVKHKCFDWLRREKLKAEKLATLVSLNDDEHFGHFYLEQVRIELMQRIYAEVDKLPARMREIFLLSYREGLKTSEIASRLNLRPQTVTNQRISAIRLLKQALSRDPMLLWTLLCSTGHFLK